MSVRNADSYISISQYAAEIGVRSLRIPPARVATIYHGAKASKGGIKHAGQARTFLFVSNLYRYKNLHRLLLALARLPHDARLLVAGAPLEESYYHEIRELVSDLQLSARVDLLGHQTVKELQTLYRGADCFVWPSYAETFGHPMLEAHSAGLPLAVADAASNREIMGEAAAYFDPHDPESIARALRLAYDGRWPAVGELPRTYSWDLAAAQTAAHIRAVV
jgi:glycosyltransferase involved in cell wall biosynthesis